jgi:hypothetical protein
MATTPYPTPQAGYGPYGGVPGQIGIPTNIYSQVNSAIPGFAGTGTAAAGVIGSQVAGQVSPDVQNLLQQKAAAMGTSSGSGGVGQPGSFSTNNFDASLGLTSQGQQQQGISNYLGFLGGVGQTQTDPNLAFQVSQQNAVDASAPNPAEAVAAQTSEFDKYMNMIKGGGNMNTGVSWTGGTGQVFPGAPGS